MKSQVLKEGYQKQPKLPQSMSEDWKYVGKAFSDAPAYPHYGSFDVRLVVIRSVSQKRYRNRHRSFRNGIQRVSQTARTKKYPSCQAPRFEKKRGMKAIWR